LIRVAELTRRFGGLLALDRVGFEIGRGEVVGFLGPNGAGKTTAMRILSGYLPATSGSASVAGFDVLSESLEVRRRIGYLPEHPPLYLEMRVISYLEHVARLKGVRRAEIADARDRVIADCGLERVAGRLCGHLSKGYRQRVGLAQALIHAPAVLVLDEPTIGLDPAQIIEIRGLIRKLATERTVILSTHILPEVAQICQKVVIINEGRVSLESEIAPLIAGGTLEEEYLKHVSGDATREEHANA
jgi:gliding motility-associated transport system ATP-binding protein